MKSHNIRLLSCQRTVIIKINRLVWIAYFEIDRAFTLGSYMATHFYQIHNGFLSRFAYCWFCSIGIGIVVNLHVFHLKYVLDYETFN